MLSSQRSSSVLVSFLFVLAALAAPAPAQAPPGYYASVDTSSSGALRTSLNAVIDDHQYFPYTSGATDTWDILRLADQDPNDAGKILDVYKNKSFSKVPGGYNREHTWPNSLGFPDNNGKNYPYTDCHMLFLCDIGYNAARAAMPYGVAGPSSSEWPTLANNGVGGGSGTYLGNSNWENGTFFEVWVDRRGDAARAMFYMDVRYEGGNHGVTGWSEPDLILTNNLSQIYASATGNNESVAYMGLLSVLLQWNLDDPVDAKEMARNNAVFNFQGNRNPFIDHPEWVNCLFSTNCGVDTTPPGAPTGLVAMANGTTIALDWNDNPELDLAGYHVWRSPNAGGPYSELTVALQATSDWSDSGLTAGLTYYYVVTAGDTSNNVSTQSNEAQAAASTGGGGGTGSGLPWINELHYDNAGSDTGEFIEVAGPAGLDLAGYQLVGYNGNGGSSYKTVNLGGPLADQGGCVGALSFAFLGLQNGAPDGVALIDPTGVVIEFLSYEGSFTAADGPAVGLLSVDIGVAEGFTTAAGESLQKGGTGSDAAAFSWQSALAETPGAPNQNQSFSGGCTLPCGTSQYDLGASPANTLVLLGSGSPNVGGSIDLVTTGLPFGGAFLGIGAGKANLPMLGGIVLVDPLNLLLPLMYKVSTTGTATMTLPIPADPAFAGLIVYAQSFSLDNSKPGGFSLSGGLEIIVCP